MIILTVKRYSDILEIIKGNPERFLIRAEVFFSNRRRKMKRSLWIAVVGAAALTLGACGQVKESAPAGTLPPTSAAQAEAKTTGDGLVLKWSEVNGDEYGATVGAKAFKEKVEEVSGGQIVIDLYENGTLGDEKTSMQGIQMGTLDIFRGNASSLPNYGAKVIGLTGLPYLFKDMAQFHDMAVSSLGQELLDSVDQADCGYVALGWMVEGPRSLFLTQSAYDKLGKPSAFSLDMMKGLKIRVPETDLMVNTMKGLGASATPIAYSELYTSLQSGVVDGAENGVTSYLSNSFNEVAPYFIPDAHTFGCGVVLMNKDKWNSLTEEQKEWMLEASEAGSEACYEYNQKQEQAAYASFLEKGVTKLEVPDLDKWQEACQSVYASYSEEEQKIIQRLAAGKY